VSGGAQTSLVDLATVAHDGKVLVVATDTSGQLRYTVRQSGFEDTAHDPSRHHDLKGFENWRAVPLSLSTDDPSVRAHEAKALVTGSGQPLTRSLYDESVRHSVPARVKLLSALEHLYLFRVSPTGKLLLNRFVLDGLTNELVPKLEVRFRRSGQRLEPEGGTKAAGGPPTDSLGYRSVDQQSFYEPTQELSFLGTFAVDRPWFSVEVLPTAEHGRHRWNFFVLADPDHSGPVPTGTELSPKLRLVSVSASAEGLLDLRDQTSLQPDPENPNRRVARTVPGIVDRAIRLDGSVVNAFDSTVYHNQVERQTKAGPQLLKENTRVMLSVPVSQTDRDDPVVAALSFTVDSLGQLAQIDRAADSDEVLSGNVKQVLLPLSDLEDITVFADRTPPPQGDVLKIGQSQSEQVQITTGPDSEQGLEVGQRVRISGTRSYDGVFQAKAVDGDTFEIDTTFSEAESSGGHWEVVDDDGGLVFDNMIASYERTPNGGLKISCVSHNIEVGDEIRISGSIDHDGDHPITKVNDDNTFELDRVWPVGEVVNLSRRPRRGLYFDGLGDYLHVPEIETAAHRPTDRFQRTVTAWVQLSEVTDEAQTIFATGSRLIHFHVDRAGKLRLDVGMADGHRASVVDAEALAPNQWTHVTATLDYRGDLDGTTTVTLGRGGRTTATNSVGPAKPLHLPLRNLRLDGQALELSTMQHRMPQPDDITMEGWINTRQMGRGVVASWYRNGPFILAVTMDRSRRVVEWTTGSDTMVGTVELSDDDWHHLAVVQTAAGTKSIYVDGELDSTTDAPPTANEAAKTLTTRAIETAAATSQPLWLGYLGAAAGQTPATGRNANSANHAGGSYIQTSLRRWTEYNRSGDVVDTFSEVGRTDSSVHLRPADSSYRLELDFTDGKVRRLDYNVRTEIGRISDVVPINGINLIDVTCEWGRFYSSPQNDNHYRFQWTLDRPNGTSEVNDWIQNRGEGEIAKSHTTFYRVRRPGLQPSVPFNLAFGLLTGTRDYDSDRGDPSAVTVNLDSNEVVVERERWVGPLHHQTTRSVYPITALARNKNIYQTPDGWYAREIMTDHGTYRWVPGTTYWRLTDNQGVVSEQLFDEVDRSREMKWMNLQPRGADHMLEFETRSIGAGVAKPVVNRIDASKTTDLHDITSATVHVEDPADTDRFDGFVADIRVWNKARSAAVIAKGRTETLAGTERNLVAHWPLGETSSRHLADATKNKAHASNGGGELRWFGEPHRAPGERAQFENETYRESASMAAALDLRPRHVLELDGVDGHLRIGAINDDLSEGYTVAAWARWDSFGSSSRVVDFGFGPNRSDILLANVGTTNNLALVTDGDWVQAVDALTAGQWVHVAATVASDGSAVLYLDGAVVASGTVGQPETIRRTSNYIGRSNWSQDAHFQGGIRDVQFWARPLTAAEVKRYGNTAPLGHEEGLLHHWSMRTGTVKGKRRVLDSGVGSARHADLVGGATVDRQERTLPPTARTELRGKLSEVQYWDVNRPMETVRAAMHDRPTGNEYGLIGAWRCGGILSADTGGDEAAATGSPAARITPDFGPDGLDANVVGDTYVSAALLPRQNSTGRAVKYGNDELVAVSQGGRYRESFEFQAERSDSTALTIDELADADDRGNPIFRITYWGQMSRTSTERIQFSPDERLDFVDLGDGWFRAEAIVTIPDGVNMIRSFEVSDVRGLWADDGQRPAREWSHLAIRKHRMELVSDSISRRRYTDVIELPVLADNAAELARDMRRIPGLERKAAALRIELDRLNEQLALFLDTETYRAERAQLQADLPKLDTDIQDATAKQGLFAADPLNRRYVMLQHNWLFESMRAANNKVFANGWWDSASRWDFMPSGIPDQYYVTSASTGERLAVKANGQPAYLDRGTGSHNRWRVTMANGLLWLRNVATGGYLGVYSRHHGAQFTTHGGVVSECLFHAWSWPGDEFRRGFQEGLDALAATRNGLLADQKTKTERLAWLDSVLADTSDAAEREARARHRELVGQIQTIDLTIGRLNGDYVATAKALQSEPQTMGLVAEDSRGLKTYGAVLGFASPLGPVTSAATAEGNVQLTYFDRDGRMRSSDYDATSDSVNAAYEQWLPAAATVAPDLSRTDDAVTLDPSSPIGLGRGATTVEAWFHYPLPFDDNGRPRARAYLTSNADGDEAMLAVAANRRLGTVVDGFFHDAGVELGDVITPGWHHVAAVGAGDATVFHLDGEQIGYSAEEQREIVRTELDFGGTGHVDIGATDHDFSNGFSCQVWVKVDALQSEGRAWRPIFDLGDGQSSRNILLYYGYTGRTDIGLQVENARLTAKDVLVPGRWINVAVTMRNGVATMYIDGMPVTRGELTEPPSGRRGMGLLGNSTWTGGDVLNGSISSLQLWNRELRADEVARNLYTAPSPEAAGLIHHWPGATAEVGNDASVKVTDVATAGGRSKRAHGTISGQVTPRRMVKATAKAITTLGNRAGGGAPFGRLGEVRLWTTALTPEEIRTHSLVTLTGSEPDLAAYFPLDDILGAEGTAADRTGNHKPASIGAASPAARTARIGSPNPAIAAFDGQRTISVAGVELHNRSFTIEYWLKRFDAGTHDWQIGLGRETAGAGLHIGFRPSDALSFDFWADGLDVTDLGDTTNRWLHIAAVYDHDGRSQTLYVDGERAAGRTCNPLTGRGDLTVGGLGFNSACTTAQMAEVRVWDHARTAGQINRLLHRRATGDEAGLVTCLPLDGSEMTNRVPGKPTPTSGDLPLFPRTDDLPITPAGSLVTAEYSTVGADPEDQGAKRAVLRRFYGFVGHGGRAALLPDKRIEELTLQWVGNAQFEPTLLGYMEGAPPVPSENLTVNYDYDGATSVELIQSDEVAYSWNRNRDVGSGHDINYFLGLGWSTSGGVLLESQISEGHVGVRGNINQQWRRSESSTVRASSTEEQRDRLDLRGTFETDPRFPHLGNRYVPKNVGYALVISGLADVFITKMKRTGRMVAYEVLPVEDVPPDINTITFVMNPSYTLNGSLDGLVGSHAADPRFYDHVPAMRAQYGSRYPASYYNLKQAYDLKSQIDRWDKQRESFFANFDARETGLSDASLDAVPDEDQAGDFGQVTVDDGSDGSETEGDGDGEESKTSKADARNEATAAYKRRSKKGSSAAKGRRREIDRTFADHNKQLEAADAFAAWQRRMEGLQIRAAKRNIVNTYVWDADGGIRFEEQSFANTIEHTIGGSFSLNASRGLDANVSVAGLKFELQAMGTLEMTQSMTKTQSATRSFDLNVRLDGVERKGVTDADDYPVLPGEKVDRYRFMSFYLEGDTEHFNDFFAYVVDPEWLLSNDEEARALRQVGRGRPNKTWRVMHRVTYVERPALMGFGADQRQTDELAQSSQEVFNYFDAIEQGNEDIQLRIDELAEQLDKLTSTLGKVKEQTDKIEAEGAASTSNGAEVEGASGANGGVQPGGETGTADSIAAGAGRSGAMVDVNRATAEELEAVNGIGPALARAIIDLRTNRGGFTSLEQVAEVDGVSTTLLLSSEPQLFVDVAVDVAVADGNGTSTEIDLRETL
jgi:competence ComEA-like helix-hairpin-helix protein